MFIYSCNAFNQENVIFEKKRRTFVLHESDASSQEQDQVNLAWIVDYNFYKEFAKR
jgi:hypothetical protein